MRPSTRSSSAVLPLGGSGGGSGAVTAACGSSQSWFRQPEQVAELRRLLPEEELCGRGSLLQAVLQLRQKAAAQIPGPAQQHVGCGDKKEQGALGDASFHGSGRLILYIGKSQPLVPNWRVDLSWAGERRGWKVSSDPHAGDQPGAQPAVSTRRNASYWPFGRYLHDGPAYRCQIGASRALCGPCWRSGTFCRCRLSISSISRMYTAFFGHFQDICGQSGPGRHDHFGDWVIHGYGALSALNRSDPDSRPYRSSPKRS